MSSNGQQPAFYILTSSWSAHDTPGEVVGTVFKGMELVQHMSWLATDSENKVTEVTILRMLISSRRSYMHLFCRVASLPIWA